MVELNYATALFNARHFHITKLTGLFSGGRIGGDVRLDKVGLGKGVGIELSSNSQDSLEGVGDTVGHTGLGRESQRQRNGSNDVEGRDELSGKALIGDIQDLGVEETSIVVDFLEDQTVGERHDGKLLQQGSLRGGNLVTNLNEVGVVHHLNLTLGNLGSNLQRLEKGSLSRVATGGTLGDNDLGGGKRTDTSRGGTGVGFQDFTDGGQVTVGKDETNVSTAALLEQGKLGSGVLFNILTDALTHHGVLSHEDFGASAKSTTGHLELLGTDIVDFDDEALGVLVEEELHASEVLSFAFRGKRHVGIVLFKLLGEGESVQTNDLTVAEKREIKSGNLGRRGRKQLSVLDHMRFS
jgi:hypothetical protein